MSTAAPAHAWPSSARRRRDRLLTGLLAAVLALLAGLVLSAAEPVQPVARPAVVDVAPHASVPPTVGGGRAAGAVERSTVRTPHARSSIRTVRLRPGDTLWALAHRYGTTVAALQDANHLGHSTVIYAGHLLTVPSSGPAHRAAPGAVPGTAAVAFARHQLGIPYRYGGTGRGGYDCSGLTRAAWHAAGVTLPRTAAAQARTGTAVPRSALRPGDLVIANGRGHVQLYAGHGRVIEAAHPGTRVRYAPLPAAAAVDAYRRPTAPARTPHAAETTVRHRAARITTGSARQAAATVFGSRYSCAAHIIVRESGWRVTATNPASGAYGLAQALPGSKMARYGADWRTNPVTQLRWMRAYVDARYGGACAAWSFWQTHHWY